MNPPEKRKIGDECRVFNEEFINLYLLIFMVQFIPFLKCKIN
jgi:hypothetical protein